MRRWGLAGLAVVATVVGSATTAAAAAGQAVEPPGGRPFTTVVERVVEGDLLLAGNSNVGTTDVDGDVTPMCVLRRGLTSRARICADNSSSAEVALPPGARVVAARLYVEATIGAAALPLRVALDGPAEGFSYLPLPEVPPTAPPPPGLVVPKLYEVMAGPGPGAVLRQAAWDVTAYVAAAGGGMYTVADIVSQRVSMDRRHAAWAIVVAYERDPAAAATDGDPRFAPRAISWHDGFQLVNGGGLDVGVGGLPAGGFGKSFHVVVGGRPGRSDNLLFDGRPLGNNATPGDVAPPDAVVLGADAACNVLTDVQNGSICVLGTAVGSAAGVDIDTTRIAASTLRAAGADAVVRVQPAGDGALAPGVIGVSVDLPGGVP